jgi:hypothetical protein
LGTFEQEPIRLLVGADTILVQETVKFLERVDYQIDRGRANWSDASRCKQKLERDLEGSAGALKMTLDQDFLRESSSIVPALVGSRVPPNEI